MTHYLICATPRCGSTLLCEALTHTGVAGRPGEFFIRSFDWHRRLTADEFSQHFARVMIERTTPNRVFGMKMFPGEHFAAFLARLRELPQHREVAVSPPALMERVFPGVRYIWITRRNKIRQAISLYKARQTREWHRAEAPPSDARPPYDFAQIDFWVQALVTLEAAWQEYFAIGAIRPFPVVYEDFAETYWDTARDVLSFLSIMPPPAIPDDRMQLLRQADALSDEWFERYLREKAAMHDYPVEHLLLS